MKNKFYIKLRKRVHLFNGNGCLTWSMEFAFFKRRAMWWFYTKSIGQIDVWREVKLP